jgi:hypothetical protein
MYRRHNTTARMDKRDMLIPQGFLVSAAAFL